MIGDACTDKDKGLGKDIGRDRNGHRGIIGRESDGRPECEVRKAEAAASVEDYTTDCIR